MYNTHNKGAKQKWERVRTRGERREEERERESSKRLLGGPLSLRDDDDGLAKSLLPFRQQRPSSKDPRRWSFFLIEGP